MTRLAARIGATLPDGADLLGQALAQMLEAELRAEPHGPIEIQVFGRLEAADVFLDMALEAPGGSPAAAFLEAHRDGVLVVAAAEVER